MIGRRAKLIWLCGKPFPRCSPVDILWKMPNTSHGAVQSIYFGKCRAELNPLTIQLHKFITAVVMSSGPLPWSIMLSIIVSLYGFCIQEATRIILTVSSSASFLCPRRAGRDGSTRIIFAMAGRVASIRIILNVSSSAPSPCSGRAGHKGSTRAILDTS